MKTWDKVGLLNRELKPYKKLASYFQETYFFTYGSKNDQKYQNLLGQNIKIFPNKWKVPSKLYSLLLPLLYRKEIRKADILKTNQMSGSWTAVLAKWLYRKKLIVRSGYHWSLFAQKQNLNQWEKSIIRFIERLAYKNADAIIITSKADKAYIEEYHKVPSKKITVIPNYIDTDLFRPLSIKKASGQICFVGRLSEQKNLFSLVKAIAELRAKLVIFGEGELEDKLRARAKNVKARIEFRGNVSNNQLPQELNKCELFILPSSYEGNPKALLEAMACGLPVIGTNVDGIKEIIKHQENGYLCETSAESIKKAISELMKDENLQKKISENARMTMVENFSLEKVLQREIRLYKEL